MAQKLRWGIMGCAQIATNSVMPAIQESESGIIAAVASRGLEKSSAVAAEFGIEKAYGSYEELLADQDIDAVYIPLRIIFTGNGSSALRKLASMCSVRSLLRLTVLRRQRWWKHAGRPVFIWLRPTCTGIIRGLPRCRTLSPGEKSVSSGQSAEHLHIMMPGIRRIFALNRLGAGVFVRCRLLPAQRGAYAVRCGAGSGNGTSDVLPGA